MSDTAILSLFFKDKDKFDRHGDQIPRDLLEPETAIFLSDLKEWYKDTPDKIVDMGRFWEWFKLVRHPSFKADKLKTYHNILTAAKRFPEHDKTAAEIIRTMVLREAASRIALEADAYANGESADFFDRLPDVWETAAQEADVHCDSEFEYRGSLKDIVKNLSDQGKGLSWRTKVFDLAAGPLRGGNFVVLAAYVDSGKTSLLASEMSYMASQLEQGKRCLWFNNEQAGGEVKLRIIQSTTGLSTKEILGLDTQEVDYRYNEAMGEEDKIIMVDTPNITPGLVKRKLRQYGTGLVCFDQLHKVRDVKTHFNANKVDHLSAVFQFGREIAKTYDLPVVTTHQARGASAQEQDQNRKSGKEDNFLEMYQLANSREAIQAEADLIVTMGRNPSDTDYPTKRYFYFAKNKLPTPGNPAHRNIRVDLDFNTEIGRFS